MKAPTKSTGTERTSNLPPADLSDLSAAVPENEPEQQSTAVFSEGAQDEIDHDLRHRMISEAAYHLYARRGYVDGFELDDWFQAEGEVDRVLNERKMDKPVRSTS